VPHVWRCGNRGNVASVLIEKPARGDFLPVLDGGYALQYSPLLEYREGKGMVLFCQLDVTGRTEQDPAAETLVRNILQYVAAWKPAPRRQAVYIGEPAGKRHLEYAGIAAGEYNGGKLSPAEQVLVVGTGGGATLAANKAAIADFLRTGGHLLALGLDEAEANAFLPFNVTTKKAEHTAAFFDPPPRESFLAGVCPADVHNRAPREVPLVTGGVTVLGDGVLAKAEAANVVFCQFPPYAVSRADGALHETQNVRRTYRRAAFQLARLLANMGVAAPTPILARFDSLVTAAKPEKRWLDGLYLDQPEERDDPYRFFRW
jgi:beta-galactosidase